MTLLDVPVITRAFEGADLSIRGDGRTIYGLAVPFGALTSVNDREGSYEEQFQYGAFTQTINRGALHRVKLRVLHDKTSTSGVAVELRQDPAGLIAAMRVSKTQRGDEMLELVRDGALDQFSVGFRPVKTLWSDLGDVFGARSNPARGASATRTEVQLLEISVVDFAAYDAALIGGVRNTSDGASPVEPTEEPGAQPIEPTHPGASWQHIQNVRAFTERLARLHKE